jgi:hypothetical protein
MKVTFSQKDWDKLRTFQNTFNQKLGLQSYVGTDYATVLVEYSPALKSMLRPLSVGQELHFTFEFRSLKCEDCLQEQPFLCAENEVAGYLCNSCYVKREQKKNKERERQAKQKEKTTT